MKPLLLIVTLSLLAGCSLLPGKVEYFQDKVKAVPAKTDVQKEHEKQAADYLSSKTKEIVAEAIKIDAPSVLTPARAADNVASALSLSLGVPASPARNDADLVAALRFDVARLDRKLDTYAKNVQPNVGKAIEGTGLIQVGFFTQWAIVLGVLALVWAGLKVYGMFNPIVGIGMNVAGRVGSKALTGAVTSLVAGGEKFKEALQVSKIPLEVQEEVQKLFRAAHESAQDKPVQELVQKLTA